MWCLQQIRKKVEYEALIVGLRLTKDLGVKSLKCQTDLQLATGQMNGEYQAREPLLHKYNHIARNLVLQFEEVSIIHVPQTNNDRADILSKLASTKKTGQQRTLIHEVLNTSSWHQDNVLEV